MHLFSSIMLAVQNAQFRLWQRRNPGATFKDYFALLVRDHVKQGRMHPTLGENLRDGKFGEFGEGAFKRLLEAGLSPEDTCVDYGCGTLRIGVHAIRYLAPGRYWGLDIDRSLLNVGADLVGQDLIAEKRPQLRVIAPDTVKEAAAAKPSLLFSIAVLIHVHPDELEEYFGNVLTIIGGSGKAIVTGKWSQEGFQYSCKSWAHSLPLMENLVDRLGGCLSVLRQEDRQVTDRATKGGTLQLRAKVRSVLLIPFLFVADALGPMTDIFDLGADVTELLFC
jgi:hypothetical protein